MIQVAIIAPVMATRAGLMAILGDDPGIRVIAGGGSLSELDPFQAEAEVVIWSPAAYADTVATLIELSKMKIGETTAILLIHNDLKVMERIAQLPIRAWGGLDPEASQAELLAAIHAVDEGLVVADPVWLKKMFISPSNASARNQELVEPLTEREVEILQLLAYGLTNKQIAARLKISAHTVKFHVSSIFTKLGTTNRVETVNLGLKMGLIVL